MKTNFRFNVVILLIGVISCTQSNDKELRKNFSNPPLNYRMNQNVHGIPLDESGQDSLIKAYFDNGYGGFTINVPFEHYLEDTAMKATLRFCEKARNAGMELWLYDENGYPSGNAGDLVIRENPEWEVMGLFFRRYPGKSGAFTFQATSRKIRISGCISCFREGGGL